MSTKELTKAEMLREIDEVAAHAKHVRIDRTRLEQVAAIAPSSIDSGWIEQYRSTEEHYREPAILLRNEEALQMGLIVGSQVWLIWQRHPGGNAVPLSMTIEGQRYVGSYTIAASQARAIREGIQLIDPNVLRDLTLADVAKIYRDEVTDSSPVQLLDERLANYRELGAVLLREFDGRFLNVLKRADRRLYRGDGSGLIQLLETKFPKSFGDWPMAKLPQVMAMSLLDQRDAGAFDSEISSLLDFEDLAELEGGADYYRPWFFIRVGLFAISDQLKHALRDHKLIEPGSDMELEFRAFTIKAMREMGERMKGWPASARELEIETHAQAFLRCRRCRVGISEAELPCPYRGVCKATHEDNQLMDCTWPLVLTTEY